MESLRRFKGTVDKQPFKRSIRNVFKLAVYCFAFIGFLLVSVDDLLPNYFILTFYLRKSYE